jgi:hypothetical protein
MAVKTFTDNTALPASDINTYLANSGLVYVKSQTIGSAVSSVTVSSAFDSTYDNYLITINGGAGSTTSVISLKLGATATGYYQSGTSVTYAGVSAVGTANNAVSWTYGGVMTTDSINTFIVLQNPNLAKRTYVVVDYIFGNPAGGGDTSGYRGYVNNTTQYTDFTFTAGTGTMTGGTITVYGYRKA